MKEKVDIRLIIINLLIWFLIGIFLLFFVGVLKVSAQVPSAIRVYNDNVLKKENTNESSIVYAALNNPINTINIYYLKNLSSSDHVYFSTFSRLNVSDLNVPRINWGAWYMDSSNGWHDIKEFCVSSGTRTDNQTNSIFEMNMSCQLDMPEAAQGIVIRYYFTNRNGTFYNIPGLIYNQIDNTFSNEHNTANEINANLDNNTNIIVNNNNNNTQSIIENNNQNTTEITNAIENINQVCNNYDFLFNINTRSNDLRGYLSSDGSIITNTSNTYVTSNYYGVNKNETYKLTLNYDPSSIRYCLYDTEKTVLSCAFITNNGVNNIVPSSDGFIRFTYRASQNQDTIFEGKYCYNSAEETNNQLKDLNDSLTSTSEPTNYDFFNDIGLSSETPITNLILIPITLYSAFNSGVSGTCQPVQLGSLYGTNLTLPCINLEQRLGSDLWTIIDNLCAIFIIYELVMLIIQAFEEITSLHDTFDDLYVPKHAATGYKPRHAKE